MTMMRLCLCLVLPMCVLGYDCDWAAEHEFKEGWELHACGQKVSVLEAAAVVTICAAAPPACVPLILELFKGMAMDIGRDLALEMAQAKGKPITLPDGTAKAKVVTGTHCRHRPVSWITLKMPNEHRLCVAFNKFEGVDPTPSPPAATPDSYKTNFAMTITPWNGCASVHTWYGTGGARLSMEKSGTLAFYAGDGQGNLLSLTPAWRSVTGSPNACIAFQGDGNIVVYGGPGAMWASGTHTTANGGKGIGEKIVIFDKHWAVFSTSQPDWMVTVATYPPSAPKALEISPWNGCAGAHTWHSPGGARLSIEKSGTLAFYAGDGQGNLLSLTPAWRRVTGSPDACIQFQVDGNIVVYGGPTKPGVMWATGTHTTANGGKGIAAKIYLFDYGWAPVDGEGKVLDTYM